MEEVIQMNGGIQMKDKILVNVATLAIKKRILSMIITEGYDFVEGNHYDDLTFKCDLLKEHILLYIHELNYGTYDTDMNFIRDIRKRGYKIILIIDSYDASVIDDALAAGVTDMIEMPVDPTILHKKFTNLVKVDTIKEHEVVHDKQEVLHHIDNENIITNEMSRALRGGYELSMVLIKYMKNDKEIMGTVMDQLKEQLRDTDRVLHYNDTHILLVCPFTKKTYIVEVENKVRSIYETIDDKEHLFTLYGLTYPTDVNPEEDILRKLEKGINNSLMIGKLKGTISDIGAQQFEAYKKMLH